MDPKTQEFMLAAEKVNNPDAATRLMGQMAYYMQSNEASLSADDINALSVAIDTLAPIAKSGVTGVTGTVGNLWQSLVGTPKELVNQVYKIGTKLDKVFTGTGAEKNKPGDPKPFWEKLLDQIGTGTGLIITAVALALFLRLRSK